MVSKLKVVILLSLLFLSLIPLVYFIAFDYSHQEKYIKALLTGHADIGINFKTSEVIIVGIGFYGFTSFSLSYFILLIVSVIVFLISIVLLVRESYLIHIKRKDKS